MTNKREREQREERWASTSDWAAKTDSFEPTSIKLPDGVNYFKPSKIRHMIDVIPYIVGQGNPDAEEGFIYWTRSVWVHNGLGIDGKRRYCCPLKNKFADRCFVCEWAIKNGNTAEKGFLDKLRIQHRMLLNVVDMEDKGRGVQVWDATFGTSKHPGFGQLMRNKINALEEYVNFARLSGEEGGKTLQLTLVEDSFPGGGKFWKVTNIEMVTRKKSYPKDFLSEATCLDECVIVPTNEELKKSMMQGGEEENEEEDTVPVRNRISGASNGGQKKGSPLDEEDEVPIKGKKTQTPSKEEEEDDLPSRNPGKKEAPASKKEEEDEWEEDEKEEEVPVKGGGKSSKKEEEDEVPRRNKK